MNCGFKKIENTFQDFGNCESDDPYCDDSGICIKKKY